MASTLDSSYALHHIHLGFSIISLLIQMDYTDYIRTYNMHEYIIKAV